MIVIVLSHFLPTGTHLCMALLINFPFLFGKFIVLLSDVYESQALILKKHLPWLFCLQFLYRTVWGCQSVELDEAISTRYLEETLEVKQKKVTHIFIKKTQLKTQSRIPPPPPPT